MQYAFLCFVSVSCVLASCSGPPPTPENYVDHTRYLERVVTAYVYSGAKNMKWSDLRKMVDDHYEEWGADDRQPIACKQAALALSKAVWSTTVEWNQKNWHEAYLAYIDKQGDCEREVEGKVADRVLQPALSPSYNVPPWRS